MSVLSAVLLAAGLLVLVWLVVLCRARVVRLHRLHVRTDAARDALGSALRRRADAASTVARLLDLRVLAAAVTAARLAPSTGPDREAAENALGRRLAAVHRAALPAALRAELAEAEQAVGLARRVYNDAVRDTLGLRSRRLVRWLHLAGTAPLPAYFEIAEADAGVTTAARGRGPEAPVGPAG